MTATYYFTLTDYGSERIAQAHGQAEIILVNLVLGDANGLPYDPISKKTRTSLVNQRASVPVQSVVVNGSIARVTATIDLSIGGFNIHELGLTDSTGKLVYIGNYHGGFKPVLANGASGELVLLIDIKADAGSQVLIQVDPTIVTANKQWVLDNFVKLTTYNAHVTQNQLEHNNLAALVTAEAQARAQADNQQSASLSQHATLNMLEHNNLLSLISTEAQVRQDQFNSVSTTLSNMFKAMYPVGSWHGSNSTSYNPATAFAPFFGYPTTWYLWPYVPAGVANTSAALGQIIVLEAGNHVQAATTRIWERLPDGASPPSYTLTASSSTVDEGSQVTFTLSTTGLAQGTQVAWNITGIQTTDISPNVMTGNFVLGSDGSATHTILLVADKSTEGTETLKFSLTYIADKFVNVTINDTSFLLERYIEYFFPDTYDVVVKPNETIEVVLLGGSGSGGGLYQQNDVNAPRPIAHAGSATLLINFNSGAMARATGGSYGVAGIWDNTGQVFNGSGGYGGTTSIESSVTEGEITLISRADGEYGKQTLADHTGGAAAILTDRHGGEGMSYATQSNPPLYGFGGGGGGGGYIKFKYKNTSPVSTRTLTLIVGEGGAGAILGVPPQQHESGSGSNGFATVHWNKP